MKLRTLNYLCILIGICLFGIFIYPTLYKFDKLDQKTPVKINRLTGETEILTSTGWKSLEVSQTELESINQALLEKQSNFEKNLKQNIIAEIENNLKSELDNYKKAQLDPNNYFTIGSTPEEVRRVMGTPTFRKSVV